MPLSDQEKQEMLADANNASLRETFRQMREFSWQKSRQMPLDVFAAYCDQANALFPSKGPRQHPSGSVFIL